MRHPRASAKLSLFALCLGYFLIILDTTAVNVALPQIGLSLHAGITGMQWILDGYTVVFASLLLTMGTLSDWLGSKRTFQLGFILFTASSILCGIAMQLTLLITFRVIQGLGASLMVPSSLALIQSSFPDKISRAKAIGIWGSIAGVAAAGGPTLGGLFMTGLGWRSVFFVNVPVGVLGLILTTRYVADTPSMKSKQFDVWGSCTTIAGLGSLAFGLIESGRAGWSSFGVIVSLIVFMGSLVAFFIIEKHQMHPMLPLSLFQSSAFSVANIVLMMLNFGFYGQLFVLSLYFQKVIGLSPLLTGIAMFPETSMAIFASHLGGKMTGRFGPKRPILIGLGIGVCGFLGILTVNVHVLNGWFIVSLAAIGFGTACTMPAATISAIEVVPPYLAGMASGAINASRQVGGVIGVALLGAFVAIGTNFVEGMHQAMIIAAGAYMIGFATTSLIRVKV